MITWASIAATASLHQLERGLMRALREPTDPADPLGPEWLEKFAIDLTSLGGHSVLTLLVVIVTAYLLLAGKRATAALLVGSAVGAALVSHGTKLLIGRARPDVVVHLVDVSTYSFPSGHALLSASIYLTLGALLARQFPQSALRRYFIAVAASITVLVGLSRVYLGVHWPSDVLAGWLVGALWAWGCWRLARRFSPRRERRAIVLEPGAGRAWPMGRIAALFKADGTETADGYSISEWWLEPHTQGPGKHVHEEDDVFFVLEGTMSFRLGDAWHDAPKGSFVLAPGGTPHDFENRGDQRAGVLNLSFPGGFEQHMPGISQWFIEHPPGNA